MYVVLDKSNYYHGMGLTIYECALSAFRNVEFDTENGRLIINGKEMAVSYGMQHLGVEDGYTKEEVIVQMRIAVYYHAKKLGYKFFKEVE